VNPIFGFKVLAYRWMLLQNLEPIFEEISPESLILGMIGLQQRSEKSSDFLGFRGQRDRFAWNHPSDTPPRAAPGTLTIVLHTDILRQRLIRRREQDTVVLQSGPL
jgi:hypothetical protein